MKTSPHQVPSEDALPPVFSALAFTAAAEALALLCRVRQIDAADLPAHEIDALLDVAFEEAAYMAAASMEARRPE
jgi:hypothetical protein